MSLLLLLRNPAAAGAAPTLVTDPQIVGTPRVGQTIVASTGSWTNAPTSIVVQWQSAATIGGTYTNVSTSNPYTLVSGDLGRFFRVVVTAANAAGSAQATSTPLGPVTAAIVVKSNLAAAWPTLIAELDFAGNGNYTDVSKYVRGTVEVGRGRGNSLDRVEAGTATAAMDTSDRRFEPEFVASPYYPNVRPLVPFRLRAAYNGTIYPLHRGYVNGWPNTWPGVKRGVAALSSADLFSILAAARVPAGGILPLGLSGVQIASLLSIAGVPSTLWDNAYTGNALDTGKEDLLGVDWSGDYANPPSVLPLIQDTADSELGVLFIGPLGYVTFHDRDHRITASRSTTTQAIFGDDGTNLPYLAPELDYGIDRVWNDVRVTSGIQNALPQVAIDDASIRLYGPRTLPRSTRLASDQQAADQATRILRDNKDPHVRFPTITLDPLRDARLWPVVLGAEISDRVLILRNPYAGGAPISKLCWVEAVRHSITYAPERITWRTTLSLSLADPSTYLTLDHATKGVLDAGNAYR